MQCEGLTQKIRDILDDGERHTVVDLVDQVRKGIPPEAATRATLNAYRPSCATLHGPTWILFKGYRIIVVKTICSMAYKNQEVEIEKEDGCIVAVRKKGLSITSD